MIEIQVCSPCNAAGKQTAFRPFNIFGIQRTTTVMPMREMSTDISARPSSSASPTRRPLTANPLRPAPNGPSGIPYQRTTR